MADQVKEIYNGSVTVADLVAGNGSGTLATTDANTQYVVKDVNLVSNTFTGVTPTLTINNTQVASVASSLTGSEIMDVSSTLKAKLYSTAPTTQNQVFKYISQSPNWIYGSGTNYLLNGTFASSGSSSNIPITNMSNLGSSTQYISFDNSGNFYYATWDGNSTTNLYRRAGGINGSDTSIDTSSYAPKCFNGVDKYHWVGYANTNLYTYNINTNATTSVSCGTSSTTSYPEISMINNGLICFQRGDSQPTSAWVMDPSTGTSTQITGLPSVSMSTYHNTRIYYNATTNRYTVWRRNNTTTIYWSTLNDPLTLGSTYSGTFTSGSFAQNGTLFESTNVIDVTSNTITYTYVDTGKTYKNTYTVTGGSTATLSSSLIVSLYTLPGTCTSIVTPQTDYSVYTNSLQLRLTGVKSTI